MTDRTLLDRLERLLLDHTRAYGDEDMDVVIPVADLRLILSNLRTPPAPPLIQVMTPWASSA